MSQRRSRVFLVVFTVVSLGFAGLVALSMAMQMHQDPAPVESD
jgi:hypothetical protein